MPSNKKWLGSGHYKLTDRIIKRLWPNFPFYRNKLLIPRNWSYTTSGVIVGGEAPEDLILDTGCRTGSLVFGANGKYVSYAGNNDWALGTGDFCIEWWQYQTAASPPLYSRLFQVGEWPNHSIAVSIENGTFLLWVNNANTYYGSYALSNYLNRWVHFAVVRQSGVSSVYQDGSRIINVSTPNNVTNNTNPLQIGFGSGNYWNGKLTNFRWVKGSSVYDGTQTTITVPTAPLAAVSGTKLLLLTNTNETYLADSSGLNKSATNNGSVTWSSDSPDFDCCDTLTFVGINANTTGNSAIKTSAGGWDGSAHSTETYTNPVSVTFKTSVGNNYLMGGFSYSPTANTDTYTNTTYGLYIQPGFLEIYENGGQVNVPGSISRLATDLWKVDYDGTNVKYYQNGNLIYTSSNPVTQPLHVFFALLTGEQGVTDICVESTTPPPCVDGCMDPTALNYDPAATCDDGSCYYEYFEYLTPSGVIVGGEALNDLTYAPTATDGATVAGSAISSLLSRVSPLSIGNGYISVLRTDTISESEFPNAVIGNGYLSVLRVGDTISDSEFPNAIIGNGFLGVLYQDTIL